MISVEQIHKLEAKVLKAVEVIKSLREENSLLKEKLSGYEKRIEELEVFIDSFKQDQTNIEEGIMNALNQLDMLEEIVSESDSDTSITDAQATEEPVKAEDITENTSENTEEEETSLENELDIF